MKVHKKENLVRGWFIRLNLFSSERRELQKSSKMPPKEAVILQDTQANLLKQAAWHLLWDPSSWLLETQKKKKRKKKFLEFILFFFSHVKFNFHCFYCLVNFGECCKCVFFRRINSIKWNISKTPALLCVFFIFFKWNICRPPYANKNFRK